MREADLVIEAVYENLELKQSIFRELDAALKPSAVLASNTSYLDIDAIAAVTARPGQVLGLHFFSPAHIMRLLEIVRGAQTAPAVLEAALALGERMGKVSVVAGNCHGFIGNRMLEPYATEARLMLLEGALPYQVDRALQAFGFAMGPFRMYDVVGIDLEWRARELAGVGQDQPAVQVDNRLCELGRFGQKSGAGYYRYAPGSRQAEHDTEVDALVLRVAETLGYPRRDFADEEILERCLLALVNEGAKILDEGIAARSADIDTVYLNGYGFPPRRAVPWPGPIASAWPSCCNACVSSNSATARAGSRRPWSSAWPPRAEPSPTCRRRAEMDYQAPCATCASFSMNCSMSARIANCWATASIAN